MALHDSPGQEHHFVVPLASATDIKSQSNFDITKRSLGPTWIVYSSASIAMLQAFHYGWSTSQVNLSTFSNSETCNARPVKEGTCLMFPGHTTTMWTIVVNAWIIGGMCGSLLSGFPSNKWGRRTTLRYNTIIMVLGSLIQVLALTPLWFAVGRFVTGIANGLSMAVVNTFLNEISTPHNRHALGTNTHLAATMGIISVATTFWFWNTTTGFRWIAGMPIAFAGLFIVLSFFFMVESPVWLVANGKSEEAEKELGRLYGKENVSLLMGWIQANNNRPKLPSLSINVPEKAYVETNWTIVTKKKFRKPLVVALGLTCANQLGGINAVFLYSSSILKNAGISDSRLGVMIIGTLHVLPVPIAALLAKTMRKRTMLITGISSMSLCCIGVTMALLYNIGWMSIVFLGLYVVSYGMSIGSLLWPIVAELFSDSARGAAVGICITVKWASTLVVGIIFPYVEDAANDYSFTPFLGTTMISVIFIYFMVPETSGKTIAEIQEDFSSDRSMQSSKSHM